MFDLLQDGTLPVQMLLLLCDKFLREPRTPRCGSFGFFVQLRTPHEPTTSYKQLCSAFTCSIRARFAVCSGRAVSWYRDNYSSPFLYRRETFNHV
jgi:hypothetical protein